MTLPSDRSETGGQEAADLIAGLEAATEGSRELDARLQAREYGEEFDRLGNPELNNHDPLSVVWHAKNHRRYTCWHNKAYTRSLDAALTLAPPAANCHGYELSPKEVEAYVQRNYVKEGHWAFWGRHPTSPAIAMCIAMLKARESLVNAAPDNPDAIPVCRGEVKP